MSENEVEYKSIVERMRAEWKPTRNIDFELGNKTLSGMANSYPTNFGGGLANSKEAIEFNKERKPIDFETYIRIETVNSNKHIAIIMNKGTNKEVTRYTLTVNKYGKLCMN